MTSINDISVSLLQPLNIMYSVQNKFRKRDSGIYQGSVLMQYKYLTFYFTEFFFGFCESLLPLVFPFRSIKCNVESFDTIIGVDVQLEEGGVAQLCRLPLGHLPTVCKKMFFTKMYLVTCFERLPSKDLSESSNSL